VRHSNKASLCRAAGIKQRQTLYNFVDGSTPDLKTLNAIVQALDLNQDTGLPRRESTVLDALRKEYERDPGIDRRIAEQLKIDQLQIAEIRAGRAPMERWYEPIAQLLGFDPDTGRPRVIEPIFSVADVSAPEPAPAAPRRYIPAPIRTAQPRHGAVFSNENYAPLPASLTLTEEEARLIISRRNMTTGPSLFAMLKDESKLVLSQLGEADHLGRACIQSLIARIDDYQAMTQYNQALIRERRK
jgi:hypothetical protein